MDKIEIIGIILIIAGVFMLGWLGNSAYRYYSNERTIDGLYFENNNLSQNAILALAQQKDSSSGWVCINTKGMTYGEAQGTCQHECTHKAFSEIMARNCENDYTKCSKLLDNWSITNLRQ